MKNKKLKRKIKKITQSEVLLEEFEKIRKKHGKLIPALIVEEAKDSKNPLHNYFEWDDSIASHNWRVHQASVLINYVIIKKENSEGMGYYENVQIENEKQYVPYYQILNNNELRKQIMKQALVQLETYRKKYETYSELKKIFKEKEIKILKRKYHV